MKLISCCLKKYSIFLNKYIINENPLILRPGSNRTWEDVRMLAHYLLHAAITQARLHLHITIYNSALSLPIINYHNSHKSIQFLLCTIPLIYYITRFLQSSNIIQIKNWSVNILAVCLIPLPYTKKHIYELWITNKLRAYCLCQGIIKRVWCVTFGWMRNKNASVLSVFYKSKS